MTLGTTELGPPEGASETADMCHQVHDKCPQLPTRSSLLDRGFPKLPDHSNDLVDVKSVLLGPALEIDGAGLESDLHCSQAFWGSPGEMLR